MPTFRGVLLSYFSVMDTMQSMSQDMPRAEWTTDREINELSTREGRVVVTKDSDFVDSFVLKWQPYKLLQVTTGNIRNAELERLLKANLSTALEALELHDYVELSRTSIIVRG